MTSIVWFRQDLRITDNPALARAARRGTVVPVYILDDTPPPLGRPLGGASRWWLHHSLLALSNALGGLLLLRGDSRALLPDLARRLGVTGVYWNRCYEPYAIARDTVLKAALVESGIGVESFNGNLLFEPWQIKTQDDGPFKVYSPFWRACLRSSAAAPMPMPTFDIQVPRGLSEPLQSWKLTPENPDWAKDFAAEWVPGEAGAQARLQQFLDSGLSGYDDLRNRPDMANVSRLSPHLHWGEVSPRQIWSATQMLTTARPGLQQDAEKFLSELGWREFATHLLYHFPTLPDRNWRAAFDAYPWRSAPDDLAAWQRGQTGYPFVDAGMRELWSTGYMHNRVRMIVASFLIKHLRIDWREGEAWFWDTLLDADLANNVASWQWVAGSGADAAPYFRIFNPIEQGRKFDPSGAYTRRWCPELARLPNAVIHAPFQAPKEVLAKAGITLGLTYPKPIVDHATARLAALAGYAAVRGAASGTQRPKDRQ